MTFDAGRLLSWQVRPVEQEYTPKDLILYALGLGLGLEPSDPNQLPFVYEEDLRVLPTAATVLGYPGFWLSDPALQIDSRKVLHGEQGLTVNHRLPRSGKVVGRTRINRIVDKGPGKGALLYSTRELFDACNGDLLCTLTSTHLLRAEGGFGGPTGPVHPPTPIPDDAPDSWLDLPTTPQTALIYRLSGDHNPLHANPNVARAAGFSRPILHGLASFGMAAYALISKLCGGQPERLRSLSVRFSAPVYPGETIRVEMWKNRTDGCSFRCRALERDVIVLNHGTADFATTLQG
jgi:acyl dehydratase